MGSTCPGLKDLMKTYRCICDAPLFFDNSECMTCHRELGFCPACDSVTALLPQADGTYRCGHASCNTVVGKCANYVNYSVCNRCVTEPTAGKLCDCCRFNETIPDLSVAGNLQKWYLLEAAKRRLFYDLNLLGLPYGTRADGIEPSLAFDFKSDVTMQHSEWRGVDAPHHSEPQKVFTGHADGRITINIREADDVEREKLRVNMGEAHRTLIGHFRHEIGHFYWDVLVKGRREDESRAVFGDHDHPTYAEALKLHYKNGAPPDWPEHYVSAYATMHPWEDFAETWSTYLDMISTLDTSRHNGLGGAMDPLETPLDSLVSRYRQLGVALNEINRNLGLLDVVPEVFVPPVIDKLRMIHRLVRQGRKENAFLQPAEL